MKANTTPQLELEPDQMQAANDRLAKIGLAPEVSTTDAALQQELAPDREAAAESNAQQFGPTDPLPQRADHCGACGKTDAEWDGAIKPGATVEMKTLKANQRCGYGTGKDDHTLYTHRCAAAPPAPPEKRARITVVKLRERYLARVGTLSESIENSEAVIAEEQACIKEYETERNFWQKAIAEIDKD